MHNYISFKSRSCLWCNAMGSRYHFYLCIIMHLLLVGYVYKITNITQREICPQFVFVITDRPIHTNGYTHLTTIWITILHNWSQRNVGSWLAEFCGIFSKRIAVGHARNFLKKIRYVFHNRDNVPDILLRTLQHKRWLKNGPFYSHKTCGWSYQLWVELLAVHSRNFGRSISDVVNRIYYQTCIMMTSVYTYIELANNY